ncbi:hypothetical protein CFC21_108257 [Triticum aestivum]|nr:hypothetical protein CFC21_108257 [Triticum aestivum]
MKVFVVVFLLLVATGFQGPVQVALARDCTSQSHEFVGMCLSDRNCASVCQTEYFTGGKCDHRRCVCTKDC